MDKEFESWKEKKEIEGTSQKKKERKIFLYKFMDAERKIEFCYMR